MDQTKKITIIISSISALGAVAGILLYLDNKKENKIKHEISVLDRDIKQLQLYKLKQGGQLGGQL